MKVFHALSEYFSSMELKSIIGLFILILLTYPIAQIVYNLYFHPLAKFPGPRLGAVSYLFFSKTYVDGNGHKILRALHEKYGPVVRWAPDQLSFASAAAWKDIYVPQNGKIFLKDAFCHNPQQISHAFSTKSLLEQEHVLIKYIDMLVIAMKEESAKGPIDLVAIYNWITFDILGEFAFGESFNCISDRKTHHWISNLLANLKYLSWALALNHISPILFKLSPYIMPKKLREDAHLHLQYSLDKIYNKISNPDSSRRDFLSYILAMRDEVGLTDWEMGGCVSVLVIAGSETTATALAGLTYWLCRTPVVYERLKREVRERFEKSEEITSQSTTFEYLTAVIHEALRIYPPVPVAMPRVVPQGGEWVDGNFVAGGAIVGVHAWSVTHSTKNFQDPETFRPERWIDPDCKDNLSASQPFQIGPRACLGQNMAWMELRILVAKLVFHFDFELVDMNLDWDRDSSSRILWEKPNLMTKITPRVVS
ncbi:hypothetical protein B7494_g2857 [Chlorociboria aeruginascens]|nr:hypothetical protein B7494_g2857 [Chlorociboria aeruginascens]